MNCCCPYAHLFFVHHNKYLAAFFLCPMPFCTNNWKPLQCNCDESLSNSKTSTRKERNWTSKLACSRSKLAQVPGVARGINKIKNFDKKLFEYFETDKFLILKKNRISFVYICSLKHFQPNWSSRMYIYYIYEYSHIYCSLPASI